MDSARARLMKALRKVDRYGCLAMDHAFTAGGEPIYVHAKIMVVDRASIRVGSANINNRSMGLDSECDVLVEAQDVGGDVGKAAATLRDGLLAEHLGRTSEEVAPAIADHGLVGAVEALRGVRWSLRPYEVPELGASATWLADGELLDPESPAEMFEQLCQTKCTGW